jgi:hypothetical protein
MATTSQIKNGLDIISERIQDARAVVDKSKSNALLASNSLAALATTHADVLSTIDGYVGSDADEALYKAEKASLTAEFTALKAVADAIVAV